MLRSILDAFMYLAIYIIIVNDLEVYLNVYLLSALKSNVLFWLYLSLASFILL